MGNSKRSVSSAGIAVEIVDDPAHLDEVSVPPTETADSIDRIKNSTNNLSKHYLFDGKFY